MAEKRPFEDGPSPQTKRSRADGDSVASNDPPHKDQIETVRARIAATKARLNAASSAAATSSPPVPDSGVSSPSSMSVTADARARVLAMLANKNPTTSSTKSPPPQARAPAAMSAADAARAKVEAMKARVAAATQKAAPPARQDNSQDKDRARGGLGIGLHPALMGDLGVDKNKLSGGRFNNSNVKLRQQNQQPEESKRKKLDLAGPSLEELRKDPYYDPNVSTNAAVGRGRKSRDLLFNQKGKYIAQAAALRRQAQLEEMKKRIAESTKKAGLDEDRSEQAFLVPDPPKVEWWDEGLVVGEEYPNLDIPGTEHLIKIGGDDSLITAYIQHPVLLEPPQEKNMPASKPMFMTKQEQAKKRRQDRMELRKEKQAKVRLGLEPPEPPKVKKSNLMRVLGEEAVKDPTAVEARVNREIAARAAKHEDENAERQLSKEERLAKLAEQQAADASKGIHVMVFRVESLANGKHRYIIDVNAKQHALTGVVVIHPKLSVVVVEGGIWAMAKYKKLMLQRVKWTEMAAPRPQDQEQDAEKQDLTRGHDWLSPTDANGELKGLGHNMCNLIWEGEQKSRVFRRWMGLRVCASEGDARRLLARAGGGPGSNNDGQVVAGLEAAWAAARDWQP